MQIESEGLRECPFCGKSPITRITFGVPLVECGNAKCLIAPSTWLRIQDTDVKAAIKEWNARTASKQEAKLTAIVKELREALEFYANGTNYNFHSTDLERLKNEGVSGAYVPINKDRGNTAKQALLRAKQIESK